MGAELVAVYSCPLISPRAGAGMLTDSQRGNETITGRPAPPTERSRIVSVRLAFSVSEPPFARRSRVIRAPCLLFQAIDPVGGPAWLARATRAPGWVLGATVTNTDHNQPASTRVTKVTSATSATSALRTNAKTL